MTPEQLVHQFLSPTDDFAMAFDRVVAAGPSAIPAIAAAIERGRGIPQLTAVLSSVAVENPVDVLAPLLDHSGDVHDAALLALGAHRDPRALPLLVAALPVDRFTAAEALGELGCAEAVAPLLALVGKYVGHDGSQVPGSEWLRSGAGCLNLRLVLTVATALAKLGQPLLAPVSLHLATLRDDHEHAEASLVRTAAVRSLHYTVCPGVARILRRAASDPDEDTARAALVGTLFLGRLSDVETWLEVIASGRSTRESAVWCLEQWSSEKVPRDQGGGWSWPSVQRWWSAVSSRFADRICYRAGAPVDIGRLIDGLPEDPLTLRVEIEVRTGARPVLPALAGNPVSPGELAALRSWWAANAAAFPAGKLHRRGRTYEPSSVD